MALVIGQQSYATVAEADDYLALSARAASNWELLGTEDKERALVSAMRLLERQVWAGERADLESVRTATVSAGGSSYVVGDVLGSATGTGQAASFTVATVSSGAITSVTLSNVGYFSVNPSSPDSVTGGSGSSAALALTFGSQLTKWPRIGMTDEEGEPIAEDEVPDVIRNAQIELAYEISQDVELEAARDANSNEKRLKAGSVEVEYFIPADSNGRFPAQVQEMIAHLLSSAAAGAPLGLGSASDEATSFGECGGYKRTDGF